MLLDYKDIIIKHYALGMSGREIAEELSVSKSGVNNIRGDFLNSFQKFGSRPLPLVFHNSVDDIQQRLRHKLGGKLAGTDQFPQTGLPVEPKLVMLHGQVPANAMEEAFILFRA